MQSGVAGGPALLPALPSSSSMHANSSNSSGLVAAEGISSSPHHPHAWATAAAAGTPVSPHHISQQQPLPVSTAYITGAGQAATAAAVAPAGALYGSGTSRHVVSVSQRIPVKVEPAKPRGRSGPKSKFSPFIGVSQYKRTGRWEVSSSSIVLPNQEHPAECALTRLALCPCCMVVANRQLANGKGTSMHSQIDFNSANLGVIHPTALAAAAAAGTHLGQQQQYPWQ